MNLPNFITLVRIASVALLLWTLSGTHFSAWHGAQELLAAVVFLLAVASGALDGRLARRTRKVTPLGTLLSPLADKLLVASAYIALVRFAPALVPAWIAVLIVGREFLVTGLHAVAEQEKMMLGVRDIGKSLMVLQTIAIVTLLLAHAWPIWRLGGWMLPGTGIAIGALWLLLTVSLVSAAGYFRGFWVEARKQSRRAPRPFVVKRTDGHDIRA